MTAPRPGSATNGRTRWIRLALLGVLAAIALPGVALGAVGSVKLGLVPVGQTGTYFDLTMRPGENRSLQVAVANAGAAPIAARTYAADVYTTINGGFGAQAADQTPSGTTRWLTYPTEVIQLPAGGRVVRRFTVLVPADTGPGEYATSLILENAQAVVAGGSIALDQVVRQAVAVVIAVAGPRVPAIAIGGSTVDVVAGRSVVSVAVNNDGNVRLKPAVSFSLTDAAGSAIHDARFQMDTFYAHTRTTVEVPLPMLLLPGSYVVRLGLDDVRQGARADEANIALVVGAQVQEPGASTPEASGLTLGAPAGTSGQLTVAALALVLLPGLALGGLVVGGLVLIGRRRSGPGRTKP